MELRETIWQGVRIELAAVAGVMLCALKFSPDTAARMLLAYLVGVAAMTVVVVVTRRRGDHAFLGPHRGSRGVRVGMALAPAALLLVLLALGVDYPPYAWAVGVCGLWLGQRVGWLLKNAGRDPGQSPG